MALLDRYETIALVAPNCIRVRDRKTGTALLIHSGPIKTETLRRWEQSGQVLGKEEENGNVYTLTRDSSEVLFSVIEPELTDRMSQGDATMMFQRPTVSTPERLDFGLDVTRAIPLSELNRTRIPSQPSVSKTSEVPSASPDGSTQMFPAPHSVPREPSPPLAMPVTIASYQLPQWKPHQAPVDPASLFGGRGVVSRAEPPAGGATGFFAAPDLMPAPVLHRPQPDELRVQPPTPVAPKRPNQSMLAFAAAFILGALLCIAIGVIVVLLAR